MRKIYLVLILYFFYVVLNIATALVKEDLYSADIKVASREISPEQRKKLAEQAFSEVLQKITGKSKTLDIQNFDKYLRES